MSAAASKCPDHNDPEVNEHIKALVAVSGDPALEGIRTGAINALSLPERDEISNHIWYHTSPTGKEKILKALFDQFVEENTKNAADLEHQSKLAVSDSSTVRGQACRANSAITSSGVEVDDQLVDSFANLAIKEWLSNYPDTSNFPSSGSFKIQGQSLAMCSAKRPRLDDAVAEESDGSISMDLESDSLGASENDGLETNGTRNDTVRPRGIWQRDVPPWVQADKRQRRKDLKNQALEPQLEFIIWMPRSPVDGEWRSVSVLPSHLADKLKELVRKKIMKDQNAREYWQKYVVMESPSWAKETRSMIPIAEARHETFEFLVGSGLNPGSACDTCVEKSKPCTMLVYRNGTVQLGILPVGDEVYRHTSWWQHLSAWVAPKLPKQLKRKRG